MPVNLGYLTDQKLKHPSNLGTKLHDGKIKTKFKRQPDATTGGAKAPRYVAMLFSLNTVDVSMLCSLIG